MKDNMKDKKFLNVKLLRYMLPLVLFGASASVLLLKISSLENTVSIALKMPPWLVCFSVAAQICSYLGSGYILKVVMDFGKSRISVVRGSLITMASATIGLAGGWISNAATTYYFAAQDDESASEAALAAVLPAVYNSTVLVAVAIAGMVYLMIIHELSTTQYILYSLILAVIVSGIIAFFYALENRNKVEKIVLKFMKRMSSLFKSEHNQETILKNIDDFFAGMNYLSKRNLTRPAAGAVANIAFDMLTLYLLFAASGYIVKPSVFLAGYSLAFLMGRSAFFVPGGAGVVEGGMVMVYTNLGLPQDVNVAVVLCYRLISFWLPSLLGFAAIIYLNKVKNNLSQNK